MPRKPAPPKKPAKQRTKRPAVAPSDDPKVIQRICDLLSEGVPLRQILREEPGMPAVTTLYQRLDEKSKLYDAATAERFTQARARGFDVIAAECLEIADDARNDFMERLKPGSDGEMESAYNAEHVQRSKLRIETRLKLLAKWDPKRYGDKLAVGGDADAPPIRTESTVTITAEDAYKRMLNGG
jgi:hypothetical protein